MNNKAHNYYIDFWKFVFSLIIVIYHSWVFNGEYGNGLFNKGYLATIFYFVVTGYLMMNSISKEKDNQDNIGISTFNFLKKKFLSLLPYLTISFVIGYILVYRRSGISLPILFSNNTIAEFFQLGIFGYTLNINSSWWYISAMLFCLAFLYPLAKKYKESFKYIIVPLIILLVIALIKFKGINIYDPLGITFIFANGFYKGIIFICLGVVSYIISDYLKKIQLNTIQKIVLTIMETGIYLFLIYNMNELMIGTVLAGALFTIAIALSFSNQCYSSKIFTSSLFPKLAKFGFLMFLNNCAIRKFLLSRNYSFSYLKLLLIFLVLNIIVAAILYFIIDILYKKIKLIKNNNKKNKLDNNILRKR